VKWLKIFEMAKVLTSLGRCTRQYLIRLAALTK
jgi:hypothetical protein